MERVQEEVYACFFYDGRAALAKRRACPRAMVDRGKLRCRDHAVICPFFMAP